ncbi:PLDc N-terminal domain-containing protein [Urechidicola vernalis]|uniref:PLDc N-terminal domain-containing protein n=1 Tax=Urechidicola vernalis TaxID=3075600 RepID=UPI003D788A12
MISGVQIAIFGLLFLTFYCYAFVLLIKNRNQGNFILWLMLFIFVPVIAPILFLINYFTRKATTS